MSEPMPEGTHLAYTVCREGEQWVVAPNSRPHGNNAFIEIRASNRERLLPWEFDVVEDDLGGETALRIHMYDDAWQAFTQIPDLFAAFAALAANDTEMSLGDVIELLKSLGAVDETVGRMVSKIEEREGVRGDTVGNV
ncbi:MAG TPA: hypothetical protein DGT23_18725 [Micromonosporaceae bacterium]|nr:hypothetical protein [Micromonosporaceae bacterium]